MDVGQAQLLLGVGGHASKEETHEAYTRRARLLHPDLQTQDSELRDEAQRAMQQLNEAWATVQAAAPTFPTGGAPSPAGEGKDPLAPERPLPWPRLPNSAQVKEAILQHLRTERFVTRNAVSTVTGVEDASAASWSLQTLIESRAEEWQTQPGEFSPADDALYDGSIGQVEMPAPSGSTQRITLYQRGSLSRQTCPDCEHGQRRCQACVGRGEVPCPTTAKCPVCSGSGQVQAHRPDSGGAYNYVACTRCSGSGNGVCPRCQGSGWKPCPVCGHRGYANCHNCRATGVLTRVLVGTVDRQWRQEVQAAFAAPSPAAQASELASEGTRGTIIAEVDPELMPTDLPQPVLEAATPLLHTRDGELMRRLSLTVLPAVRAKAQGSDGLQTVWLLGSPPTAVAPGTEARRRSRRNRWLAMIASRALLAAMTGAALGWVLALRFAVVLALASGVVAATVVGVVLVRPLLDSVRTDRDAKADPKATSTEPASPPPRQPRRRP